MLCVPSQSPDVNASVKAAESDSALSWTLSTDDTIVRLSVSHDRPVLGVLASKADNHNWLSGPLNEELMPTVEVDGKVVHTDWRFQTADFDAKQLVLHFENPNPRLNLISVWRARPGPGPVEHWLTVTNESKRTATVTHQDSLALDGLAPASSVPTQVWWINRGGINASREGGTFVQKADAELNQILKSDPGNPSSPVPWLAVQTGMQRGLYVGWEFSGIGRIQVKTVASKPTRLSVRVGNLPQFKTDLNPGEELLVPPAFVGCYHGDIEEGSYSLHRFVLDKLLPSLPAPRAYPSLIYNLWVDNTGAASDANSKAPVRLSGPLEGAGLQLLGATLSEAELADASRKVTQSDLLRAADFASSLGFETLMVDAVWFPQTGDWRWDPSRFPQGDRALREFLDNHNMQLGLWMAYTHGSDSKYPGAMNVFLHHDWFTRDYPADWKSRYWNWTTLLDLGYEPARDWAVQETERVVADSRLDYFKHDYSPIVTHCEQPNHHHKHGVDVGYWSVMGYYHVQEELKRRFPNLMLEGCSGGGHIKDFGYIHRVHYIATTDTMSALPDRQSIWDSTFAFPPAVLMAYTRESVYDADNDKPKPYLWRSAMMSGWQLLPSNSQAWTNAEKASLRRQVEIYKDWIRPILRDAKVHHILPRPDGLHWDGMFYWSPSVEHGVLYIFRPSNDQSFQRVALKGLDGRQTYHVWSEEGSVPRVTQRGRDLMTSGLPIRLLDKYSSDLIYVERAK